MEIGVPPVIIQFTGKSSLTKSIQLWGYPHDNGNLHVDGAAAAQDARALSPIACVLASLAANGGSFVGQAGLSLSIVIQLYYVHTMLILCLYYVHTMFILCLYYNHPVTTIISNHILEQPL